MILDELLFTNSTTISTGGISFTIPNNTLKISINISGWSWETNTTNNRLDFKISLISVPPITGNTSSTQPSSDPSFSIINFEFFTSLSHVVLAFNDFAVFTNFSSIASVQNIQILEVPDESTSSSKVFILRFPGPFMQVFYDPSIAVLLGSSSSSSSGGSNGGTFLFLLLSFPFYHFIILSIFSYFLFSIFKFTDGSSAHLEIILPIVIPVAILLVCLVLIIAAIVWIWKDRSLRRRMKDVVSGYGGSVNVDEDSDDDDDDDDF